MYVFRHNCTLQSEALSLKMTPLLPIIQSLALPNSWIIPITNNRDNNVYCVLKKLYKKLHLQCWIKDKSDHFIACVSWKIVTSRFEWNFVFSNGKAIFQIVRNQDEKKKKIIKMTQNQQVAKLRHKGLSKIYFKCQTYQKKLHDHNNFKNFEQFISS